MTFVGEDSQPHPGRLRGHPFLLNPALAANKEGGA
jgi:hypothetical protein